MPKTPDNKQVTTAPEKTKELTPDERALAQAQEQATDKLRDGCVWVTYVGIKPLLAQPSVTVPAQGRSLRFFKEVRKAVPKKFADKLIAANAAFKLEG